MMQDETRDRIVDLLNDFYYSIESITREDIEKIAKHLISNGVIVPICKEGDLVYAFYNTTEYTSRYYMSDKEKIKKRNRLILSCSELTSAKSIEIREIAYKKSYSTMLGKTIFLTREEAEKALKDKE